MTDKRFQANYQGDCLVSITDKQNHENIDIVQMVDLLNALNDGNEQLKKELKQEKHFHKKTIKELQEYKDFMGLG